MEKGFKLWDMSMGEQDKHRKHCALSVCQSQVTVVKTVDCCLIDCYLH